MQYLWQCFVNLYVMLFLCLFCSCLQIANRASELGWNKMTLSDTNLTLSGLCLVGPLWEYQWALCKSHIGIGSWSSPLLCTLRVYFRTLHTDYYRTNESVPLRLDSQCQTCSGRQVVVNLNQLLLLRRSGSQREEGGFLGDLWFL